MAFDLLKDEKIIEYLNKSKWYGGFFGLFLVFLFLFQQLFCIWPM